MRSFVKPAAGSSSSQITGSVGNPIRFNSVYASEPVTGVAAVCSVAGYSPAASNKYFAVASCPVRATLITSIAINSAEALTSSLMFFRTSTTSFAFLVPVLFLADFFAVPLPFPFAFFTVTASPPQNLGGAGVYPAHRELQCYPRLLPLDVPFKCLRPKTRKARWSARLTEYFFFLYSYIQNSILQRVIGTFWAKLYLPRHQ